MSSFQSLVESGECGTSNPVLDLAMKFANPVVDDPISVTLRTGSVNALPQDIAGIGQAGIVGGNGHNSTVSSAAVLVQQTNPNGQSFDMQSLLDQMKQMEDNISNGKMDPIADLDPSQTLKPDSTDPLINASPNIEEDLRNEALLSALGDDRWDHLASTAGITPDGNSIFGNLQDFPINQMANTLNPNWADEYFRTLTSLDDDTVNLFDSKEEHLKQSELLSYRNHPLDDNFDSFFSVDSFGSSSYFKSLTVDHDSSLANATTDSTVAFNFRDQEERLINMLSSNNILENDEADVVGGKMSSDIRLPEEANSQLNYQQQPKFDEKFFYENQFDDVEFWSKLAEDWESSNKADQQAAVGVDGDASSMAATHKPVPVLEPLEELLKPEHKYHYHFIERNPFMVDQGQQQQQQTVDSEQSKAETETPDYISKGVTKMEIGDLTAAVLYFEAAAQTSPDNVEAWRLLGYAQSKNENDRKAIGAMKRCLALEPANLDALLYMAIGYTNESASNEACNTLLEWLKQHPQYRHLVANFQPTFPTVSNLDKPYIGPTPLSQRWAAPQQNNVFTNGVFNAVHQAFIDAAQMSTDQPDADVQCCLGVLFNISGDYDKAADCFQTAVAVRHTDHTLWNRLGATLANGGKAAEAMSAYREALLRYPGYIRARYNLGISCYLLGAYREAIDHLLAVLNLQTSGSRSLAELSTDDAVLAELVNQSTNSITSDHVWNTLRSALLGAEKEHLWPEVERRDLDRLNQEFNFQLNPSAEASEPGEPVDAAQQPGDTAI